MMKRTVILAFLALTFTSIGQVPDYVPTDGLVAYYPFDGSLFDTSGSGLHGNGSIAGYGSSLDTTVDGAAFFNGNHIVSLPLSLDYPSRAIAVWVKPMQNGWQLIVSEDNNSLDHGLSVVGFDSPHNPNAVGAQMGSIEGGLPSQVDTWTHVVATRNADSTWIYFNGQLQSSGLSTDNNSITGTLNMRLGSDRGGGRRFYGYLDDLVLFNRVLNPNEISSLYTKMPAISGCTDEQACNYDVEANVDDGSCISSGCTDGEACNYNASAGCDDSSCVYPPILELGSNTTLCEGESIELSVQSPGLNTTWNTGAAGNNLTVTETGTYSVESGTSLPIESSAVEFGPGQLGIMGAASPELDLAGTSEVTLATWVKLNSNSHQFRLVSTQANGSNHQQYALMVSSGRLYFISGSSSYEANGLNLGSQTLPTDTWIHAAVTVSSDGVRFYLDGELDLFNPVNDLLPSGNSDLIVLARRADGGGGNGIPEQLDGSLSQVSIWNRALSVDEMAELPSCPPSSDSPGLIGLWLAELTPTSVMEDETGYGSDIDLSSGTLVNGPNQNCSSCSASDTVTINFIDCEILCGPGTSWDPILESCVADTPDAVVAEDCSLFTLQELSSGYLLQQGQLDLQDTLIVGLQQQVDSLNALLNNCLQND